MYVFSASFFKVIHIDCGSSTRASTLLGYDGSRDNARASLQNWEEILALEHAVVAPDRAPFPVIAAVHGHVYGLGVDLISLHVISDMPHLTLSRWGS